MTQTGNREARFGGGNKVSSDPVMAADMLIRLEDSEAKRLGARVAEVRTVLARHMRAGVGTLRNIRRGRRKTIPAWLMNAIRSELVRVLEQQIAALEHDLQIYRQVNGGHRSDALAAIETALARHKETLRES